MATNAGEPAGVLVLNEVGKTRQWTLQLQPAHLELTESPGTPPYVILRDEMMKSATLFEGMQILALNKPTKINFKLDPAGTQRLADWIGKGVLAKFYLKRRYAWVLPVAILWIIGSMPLPADAANRGQPFDVIGFVMALTLLVSWAFAKWRPHPVLFLIDSIWFLFLAGRLIFDVWVDGRSKGWLILVALLLWMVVTGLKYFGRFRGTIITRA